MTREQENANGQSKAIVDSHCWQTIDTQNGNKKVTVKRTVVHRPREQVYFLLMMMLCNIGSYN